MAMFLLISLPLEATMSYLVRTLYNFLALVPGLAARTHRPCGRMRNALRIVMGLMGVSVVATSALCGTVAYRGLREEQFGYFLAGVLVALAAFLLIGGTGAVLRAVRNPGPAALPANVIPFLLIGGTGAVLRAVRNPGPAALPTNVIPFRRPAPAPREHPGYHRRSLD
jgi:hypothetical protein